jgi:predicted MFS family arabinose efflux permease
VNEHPAQAEPRVPRRRARLGGALRFRDFRLLWFGLLVGNVGNWMQFTTLGYFVAYLGQTPAQSALNVGLLGASRAVPVLLISPLAGVVADRYPRKRILMLTNGATSFFSLLLAVLTATHAITLYEVFILSGALATTLSFDSPARQSWIPSLVPREHLSNAIGLNQVAFNLPGIIGPPLAGVLISSIGIAASFYVNAATVLAVVVALAMMKPAPAADGGGESVLHALGGGIRFITLHPVLRWVIFILFVNAVLVRPYNFLLPAYALHVVHTDAPGLGTLMAAAGFGGVVGAVLTAMLTSPRRGSRWFVAAASMALAMLVLGLIHGFWSAAAVLFGLGLANLSFTGASNYLIQTLAPSEVRGRALSVYSMIMLGVVPVGTLVIGLVASFWTLRNVMAVAGALSLASVIWVWLAHPALRKA